MTVMIFVGNTYLNKLKITFLDSYHCLQRGLILVFVLSDL